MAKRMIIMLLLVGLVLGAVFGFQELKTRLIAKALEAYAAAPQTVSTATAGYEDWVPQVSAVGTVRAIQGVDVAAEVGGIVDRISFASGQDVKAGDELVRLRADSDTARLAELRIAADLAKINYDRDQRQFRAQAVSQAQLDTSRSNLKSAEAQVDAQKALIAQKLIRAPFAGRLGIRRVDLGQYIGPGTVLVTLQSLDPIYVDFMVPQQQLATIAVGQKVDVASDAVPGHDFTGSIAVIDAQVDTGTRNIRVRARVTNPEHLLLPGMFANVTITTGAPERLLTLPVTAIAFNPYGSTVFVVNDAGKGPDGKEKLTVEQTFVRTGEKRGNQIAIESGITAGQTVVSAGQIKLRNGTAVVVDNSVQPDASADPKFVVP
jgi:membrane fusion protein (multidrug efflux system)